MGNPFAVNKLKYTSGCGTFPNASLLVRTFDYSVVLMILLLRDSTSFSRSRYKSKLPRGTQKSYGFSLRRAVHQNVPHDTNISNIWFHETVISSLRTQTYHKAGLACD